MARLRCAAVLMLSCMAIHLYAQRWPDKEADLVARYARIPTTEAWEAFSPRFNATADCRAGRRLRWAYFTRHSGTLWDWIAIADHLNILWTRVQNRNLWELVDHKVATDTYVSTEAVAAAKWRGMGQLMCHMGDVLVFGDVIPDARPVLEGNCTTPTLLLITNRFDVGVSVGEERLRYYKFMSEVVQRPWVWFIANNPYDVLYVKSKGVQLPPERTLLLRPVGASFLPKPLPEEEAARTGKIALIAHVGKAHMELTTLLPWLEERKLMGHVAVLGKYYGGPVALSQYRATIQIPYQVSVMKMYESMAYGAVFLLPSPTFFVELLRTYNQTSMEFCCRPLLKKFPERWAELMDWYNEGFLGGHVMFESWEELEQAIKGEGRFTAQLFQAKKIESQRLMLASRKTSLDGYRDVVAKMEKQSCEFLRLDDLWPPPYMSAWAREPMPLHPGRWNE